MIVPEWHESKTQYLRDTDTHSCITVPYLWPNFSTFQVVTPCMMYDEQWPWSDKAARWYTCATLTGTALPDQLQRPAIFGRFKAHFLFYAVVWVIKRDIPYKFRTLCIIYIYIYKCARPAWHRRAQYCIYMIIRLMPSFPIHHARCLLFYYLKGRELRKSRLYVSYPFSAAAACYRSAHTRSALHWCY